MFDSPNYNIFEYVSVKYVTDILHIHCLWLWRVWCFHVIELWLALVCAAVTQSESSQLEAATKAKLCTPLATMCPDSQGTASMEMLVGSQKRKARKTKITHLVRTADGRVSPVEGELPHRLVQFSTGRKSSTCICEAPPLIVFEPTSRCGSAVYLCNTEGISMTA